MFTIEPAPSDYSPEPGRVKKVHAVHDGFATGDIESSEVDYFFAGNRWVHLWTGD